MSKVTPGPVTTGSGIGPLLAREAAVKGVGQRDLAARAGTTQATISRLLLGKQEPYLPTLLRVLGALGRDLAWLHRQGVRPPDPAP